MKSQYRITRLDANNFAVQKYVPEKVNESGKVVAEYWTNEYYYNTLEGLCNGFLNHRTVGSDAKEILESLNEAKEELTSLLNSFEGKLAKNEIQKPPSQKNVVGIKTAKGST